jgi:hypothetical protein
VRYIKTKIALPPRSLPAAEVRKFLEIVFERYRWFTPTRYSFGKLRSTRAGGVDYESLMRCYEKTSSLDVFSKEEQDYFMLFPVKPDHPPYTGGITWVTATEKIVSHSWRAVHLVQVVELMNFFGSPLAVAAVWEDMEHKTVRLVEHDGYQEEVFTIRDYSEGLAGLFWRNFYGPPFVRLFGERLNSLPAECVTRLGEELVVVQPYELPTEAGTEAARAREQHLISLLGPECFYDHEHHRTPTRRPVL